MGTRVGDDGATNQVRTSEGNYRFFFPFSFPYSFYGRFVVVVCFVFLFVFVLFYFGGRRECFGLNRLVI